MTDAGYSYFKDPASMPVSTWYHLATVMSGTTGHIYVNGALTASSSSLTPPANVVRSNCRFGFNGETNSNAAIDEVKFYSRALSAAEVQTDAQTAVSIA